MLEIQTLVTITLPVLGAFIGYFIKSSIEKKQALLSEVSKERREHYQKFIDLMIELFNTTKSGKKIPDKDLVVSLNTFYKKYILYASPKVINSFSDYFQYLYRYSENTSAVDSKVQLRKLTRVMKAMRADLGLSNNNLGKDGEKIFRALIKDFDDVIK
ncbi:hypothetical protein [Myroides odoratimimus]|uniref:hypothetical protein n=1 Tax=Myroides odoratimimus TaxID=76832 RepID=UPI0025753F48|nr:hypothetical protein [Myroides odoratimimus]MDM1514115.1 hypothetical protein [Myroides odoratimimus]